MEIFDIPFTAMASNCQVVIAANDEKIAKELAALAVNEVRRIEQKFSRYRDDSIITKINRAAGKEAISCDDETLSLLNYANSLYQASSGLFDITSGVFRRVWNFKEQRLPTTSEVDEVRKLVDWQSVQRKEKTLQLPIAGMEIDFGGFGKEYAADRAASIVSHKGIRNGYVNLGGDLRVIGPKPNGDPWMIGIQDPRREKGHLIATIPVEEGGLATSGDYERFFEVDGKRYCHIVNPRTGQPASYWRSISVLAPLAVVAGNCTTIAMLMEEDGKDFLDRSGMRYLAIRHDGEVLMNKGDAS